MSKKLFTTIFIISIMQLCPAGWEQFYDWGNGDYATDVIQALDGGYIIAGYTYSYSSDGYPNILVFKIDESGEIIWTQIDEADNGQWLNSIAAVDSGYIAVGYQSVPAGGGEEIYIVKLDIDGNIIWTKTYAPGSYQEANNIITLSSGYIIVSGYTETDNHDALVLCLNEDGDTIWTKTFGGDEWDELFAAQQSIENPNEFYIVGYYGISIYDEDLWIVKMDASGDTLWTKTYGGTGYDEGYGITAVDDGYAIAGATSSFGAGLKDAWFLRINAYGDTVGSITYGNENLDASYDAFTISPYKVVFIGYTTDTLSQNIFALEVSDTDGSETWTRIYGSDTTTDAGVSICKTNDSDGMIIAGNTSTTGFSENDIYLIRTDTLGLTAVSEKNKQNANDFDIETSPNPFNSSVNITVLSSMLGVSNMRIYDLRGNVIATPYSAMAGFVPFDERDRNLTSDRFQRVIWQPDNSISSGIYLVRVEMKDGNYLTRRIVYLK